MAAENPVRFIDAFVGQLELAKAGFTKAQLSQTGRPPYDPGEVHFDAEPHPFSRANARTHDDDIGDDGAGTLVDSGGYSDGFVARFRLGR